MPDELLRQEAIVITLVVFAVWAAYFGCLLWGWDDATPWWPGELAAMQALPAEPLAIAARPVYHQWPGGPRTRFALPTGETRLALASNWRTGTDEIPVVEIGQPVPDHVQGWAVGGRTRAAIGGS